MFSIATDFSASRDNPEPHLKKIAEAGFSYVHWCHQWCTDYIYTKVEIDAIKGWLKEYGLKLLDLHGSVGPQKNWGSCLEWQRLAGVELVENRIRMTAELGGDAVIMHFPRRKTAEGKDNTDSWNAFRKSMKTLSAVCTETGIRIAIENHFGEFQDFLDLLDEFDSDILGICYDSGHGNMSRDEIPLLAQIKDRLIAIHLHDNNGIDDQHKIPFTGTLKWEKLAPVIAASSYDKPINLEVSNSQKEEDSIFLKHAYNAAEKFDAMIKQVSTQ